MKRVYVLVLLFCLMFSFASAVKLEYKIDNDVIVKEFPANLTFDLEMKELVPGYYNVYTLSNVYLLPYEPFYVDEPTSLTKTFTIIPMDRLLEDVNGSYSLKYTLHHRGVKKYDDYINLRVLGLADIVTIESELVDIKDNEILIVVRNLYDYPIYNLTGRFSSILFDVEATFDLPARDSVTFTIPISNSELRKVKAGSYLMDVVFETPKGSVSTYGSIYLMAKEDIVTNQDSGGLFIFTETVNKINTGNTVEDVRIELKRNIFTQLFTSFNLEPIQTVREGSQVRYIWSKKLTPSEVYTVKASTNYIYPLLILVVLYVVWVYTRKAMVAKIVVSKKVTPVKTRNGEFALRVRIILRAKASLEEVSVADRIPRTVKIYKKFGLSMPDEIDTVNRRLKWNAGDMRAGEERVYSYVVYSRVGFLGRFVLPAAVCRFRFNGREKRVESSSVFFMAEGSEE